MIQLLYDFNIYLLEAVKFMQITIEGTYNLKNYKKLYNFLLVGREKTKIKGLSNKVF